MKKVACPAESPRLDPRIELDFTRSNLMEMDNRIYTSSYRIVAILIDAHGLSI